MLSVRYSHASAAGFVARFAAWFWVFDARCTRASAAEATHHEEEASYAEASDRDLDAEADKEEAAQKAAGAA